MSSASGLDTIEDLFRKVYTPDFVRDLTLRDHVWFNRIMKQDGFTGLSYNYFVRYGNPQGISGTFATARANASPSKGFQFTATRAKKFGVVTIDGESILASADTQGAFDNLAFMETDAIIEEVADSLAFDFYRTTSGLRGRISSISTNTILLTEPDDARNFKEGMKIVADDSALGTTPRTGTPGACEVQAVDEDAGTVTVTDITDITGIQANDYLFREGDPGTCYEGLQVCTPLAAPVLGSDSFRGKDRGRNPSRLAGSRLDDTTLNPEVALGRLAVKISKAGKSRSVNEGYLNSEQFFNVAQRLNAKVEYTKGGGTADYGFEYILIHTAAGVIRVFSDPDCPPSEGRVSREGSQYIKTLLEIVHFADHDGKGKWLRQSDSNGIEARVESFGNLIQEDTTAQGVCSLDT
jgi:hypothetical protein